MEIGVGVREVDGRAREHGQHVRFKHPVALANRRMFLWRWKRLSRNFRHVDDRIRVVGLALANDAAMKVSREDRPGNQNEQTADEDPFHDFRPFHVHSANRSTVASV